MKKKIQGYILVREDGAVIQGDWHNGEFIHTWTPMLENAEVFSTEEEARALLEPTHEPHRVHALYEDGTHEDATEAG